MVLHLKIGEVIELKMMTLFVKAMVSIYFKEYLKKTNNEDIVRFFAVGKSMEF